VIEGFSGFLSVFEARKSKGLNLFTITGIGWNSFLTLIGSNTFSSHCFLSLFALFFRRSKGLKLFIKKGFFVSEFKFSFFNLSSKG